MDAVVITEPSSDLPPGAAPVASQDTDWLTIGFVALVVVAAVIIVLGKLVLVARLFGVQLRGGDKRIEDPRRPREPGQDGPQVAGMDCAACRRNILSDFDGMTCADCALPIHKKCHGKHVTKAHAPTTPGAYR